MMDIMAMSTDRMTNSISVSLMSSRQMRVALVVPHIFMHREIMPSVIFSPGVLALTLADQLTKIGVQITLFSPGPVDTLAQNVNADLSLFEAELAGRGDTWTDLLKKHPFTFVTLARQVQAELISKAYQMANNDEFDVVHIYTNEEELGMVFAGLCQKPVVFTHHDPFNFLVRYKSIMPRYKHLNWLSISDAQRKTMPDDTNWLATIYHGIDEPELTPVAKPSDEYFAYLGRIIKPKGVHLAIEAVREYNKHSPKPMKLKIAGKYYGSKERDNYWSEMIEPQLDEFVEYVGFINDPLDKRDFLGNARALIVPSLFDEPFGLVTVESFACGTPVVALDSAALSEVIDNKKTGLVISKGEKPYDEQQIIGRLAGGLKDIGDISRSACRSGYEQKFTAEMMAARHKEIYQSLIR